jgi:ribonuclease HI
MAATYHVIRSARGSRQDGDGQVVLLQFDGGSRGNPGPSGAGFVIKEPNSGRIIYKKGVWLGHATNNVAEYNGLLSGLDYAYTNRYHNLLIEGDSLLVVNHLKGIWKASKMATLFNEAQKKVALFTDVGIRHVYRRENSEADDAANAAMDKREDVVLIDKCSVHKDTFN